MPYFASIKSDQYPATDELQCVSIYIPEGDEFKALLAGLVSLAIDKYNYDEPDSAQTDGLVAVWDTAYSMNNWNGCGIPPECEHMQNEATILTNNMTYLTGNPLVLNNFTNHITGVTWAQNTPNNGDIRKTYRNMAAGAWNYRLTGVKTAASAKCKFQFNCGDGSIIYPGTHDFYAAGTTINSSFTGTFTNAADGLCVIALLADGKNASSGGYRLELTMLELWQDT